MKITYAHFENFAGLYAGLGTKEVTIDFSKSDNRIVMLLGGNGAGKTTLLSLLHPFRGTNDKRNNFILEDHNGYKEIHMKLNESIYKIMHHYGKVNKSYILKDDVELNENGGIKTFDNVLNEEFNLTKDYFKIGRLGSNVTTFIDLETADRKKYMNKFLPDIDDYLIAYDTVNEKFKAINTTMKSIKGQLEKLDDKENLISLQKTLETNAKSANDFINKIRTLIDRSDVQIINLNKQLNLENGVTYKQYMNQLTQNIQTLESVISQSNQTLANIFTKYPKLSEYDNDRIEEVILEYNNKIVIAEQEMKTISSNIDNVEKNIVRLFNDKNSKKNIIKGEVDISYIEQQIEDKETLINEYREYINESPYGDMDYTPEDMSNLQYVINDIVSTIESIKSQHTLNTIDTFEVSTINTIDGELTTLYDNLKIHQDKHRHASTQIKDLEHYVCSIDSNETDTSEDRIDDWNMTLCEIDRDIAKTDRKINELESVHAYIKDIIRLKTKLQNNYIKRFIIEDEISDEDVADLLKEDISKTSDLFNITDLVRLSSTRVELSREEEKLSSLQSHLKLALQQKEIIDQAKRELVELEEEIVSHNSAKLELINSNDAQAKIINVNKQKLILVNNIKKSKRLVDEQSKELEVLNADYQNKIDTVNSITDEENKIIENNSLIVLKEQELSPQTAKLKTVQRDLIIIDDCVTRLKDVEENFNIFKIVKDALDPKKGIPLFFIDNYLKDIAIRANNLLSVAYGDAFKIKFDISASDFFINVFKADGTFLSDIKQASQGETSLTTVSLSLGMIERMMTSTKYNILYLDEIDSTLSTKNRRLFISLLENQLEKLGVDQVFVISHNNEFESHPTDLILLKENNVDIDDKEFMQNKNVLFHY